MEASLMVESSSDVFVTRRINEKNKGYTTLFSVQFPWPFQRCRVAAECVTIRKLTLLEMFILRSFDEIENVSAQEIAEQLGLFEPILLERTIDSLRDADAIKIFDSHEPANSVIRKSWADRIADSKSRLEKLTATTTKRGKRNLRMGNIDSAPEKRIYEMFRSLIGGTVFSKNTINPNDQYLEMDSDFHIQDINERLVNSLADEDVNRIINEVGNLGQSVEIRSQSLEENEDGRDILASPIYVSILIDPSNGKHWVVTDGKGARIQGLTEEIQKNPSIKSMILAKVNYHGELPILDATNDASILPFSLWESELRDCLAHSKAIISNGIVPNLPNSESVDVYKAIFQFRGAHFCVTKKSIKNSERPFIRKIGGDWFPEATIASNTSTIMLRLVNLSNDDEEYNIPVCVKDKEFFERQAITLLPQLDTQGKYALHPNHNNFASWVKEVLQKLKPHEVAEICETILDDNFLSREDKEEVLSKELGDYFRHQVHSTKVEDAIVLKSIVNVSKISKMNLWSGIELSYQEKVMGDVPSTSAMDHWRAHKNQKKILPFEDAVNLESHLFRHCNETFHELFLEIEEYINTVSEQHGITDDSFTNKIDRLAQKDVFSGSAALVLKQAWRNRNAYSHPDKKQKGSRFIAQSKDVIEAIKVCRDLKVNNHGVGLWAKPIGTKWDTSYDERGFVKVLNNVISFIKKASTLNLPIDGDIWFKPLLDAFPGSGVMNHPLLELLTINIEVNTGTTFEELRTNIMSRMINTVAFDDAITSSNEGLNISAKAEGDIRLLESLGYDKEREIYLGKLIGTIPIAKSVPEFLEQSNWIIPLIANPDSVMNERMSSVIDSKEFSCDWEELLNYVERPKTPAFSNVIREKMLTKAITDLIRVNQADPIALFKKLESGMKVLAKNQNWKITLLKKEGWLGHVLEQYIQGLEKNTRLELLSNLEKSKKEIFIPELGKLKSRLKDIINKNKNQDKKNQEEKA